MSKLICNAETAKNLLNDKWSIQRIEDKEKLFNEVKKFFTADLEIHLNKYENSETYYINQIYVILQKAPFQIRITDTTNGKFRIFTDYGLKNVSNYCIERTESKFDKPNYIGKFSTKKIQNWVDYYTNIYNELVKENDNNSTKITAFLEALKNEKDVKWFDEGKKGEIVKNGIQYAFTIHETYIEERINLHYTVSNSLESFKKLSDNKYI